MASALGRDKRGVPVEGPGGGAAPGSGSGQPTKLEGRSSPTVTADKLWLGPGMVVDDFAVVSQVSDSTMLQTFEAVRRGTGRTVALQVLSPMWRQSQGLSETWVAWGDAIRRIHHPGLAECDFAGVSSEGLAYAVFEWLDGVTLRSRLESANLEDRDALKILVGVLEALDAAHGGGIVHGDVRPENVFCTSDGDVKLLCLGLAECLRACQSTSDTTLLASAAYVSPEQIAGAPASVQSDLYAFGMLAHECLLGRHPLVVDGPWPSASDMLLRQVQRPPERIGGVPAALRRVIERTTAKSPKHRPVSAREVLGVFRAFFGPQAGVRSHWAEGGGGGQVRGDVAPFAVGERNRPRRVSLARPRDAPCAAPEPSLEPFGVRHGAAVLGYRTPLQSQRALQARRRTHPSRLPVWIRWPYGHMVIGGVLGVVAGVLVYLWQTHRSAPHADRSFGAEQAPTAVRRGSK